MVGWHHRLNGHEFEQALEDSEKSGYRVGEQLLKTMKKSKHCSGTIGQVPQTDTL